MPDPSTLATRELDAAVLVAICGWRWMRDKKRKLCALHPPEPYDFNAEGVWLPMNYDPEDWEPYIDVPSEDERFYLWHRAVSKMISPGHYLISIPSPSTNAQDMLDVLAKWDGDIKFSRGKPDPSGITDWRCMFFPSPHVSAGQAVIWDCVGETPMLAACRAILKATVKP